MIGKRRQVLRRKGGEGFLFIYRGVLNEEVRLKNQKWRDANWPVIPLSFQNRTIAEKSEIIHVNDSNKGGRKIDENERKGVWHKI